MRPPLRILALGLVLALATSAAAEDDAGRSWIERWLEQPTLTGNWFGLRDRLGEWGITPTASYATDLLANPLGGRRRGAAYAADLNVTIDVDFARLASIPGLSGQVSGDWSSGTNLSQDIGNFFQVAQYFEGSRSEVTMGSSFSASRWSSGKGDPGPTRACPCSGPSCTPRSSASTPCRTSERPASTTGGSSPRGGTTPRPSPCTMAASVAISPGRPTSLVLEWTYAIAVTPWLTVQPDVQYVINPRGRSNTGNTLVVGAQMAVQF